MDQLFASMNGLQRINELARGKTFRDVPMDTVLEGPRHALLVKIPRIDHGVGDQRIRGEFMHSETVALRVGERVVQCDVDGTVDRGVGVELDDLDAIAIVPEHGREALNHHFVVVDESNCQRRHGRECSAYFFTLRGEDAQPNAQ